ncbi:hypothetical protein LOH54_02485 [Sulfurimonas sp. HSL-3221]|uniref:hypothetical protein n=1 Tax=Sulfurimonadaceae TaxID=2771471 RepID=UPI001E5778B4|nr:hypothetical protein [Sulfurimonas sp. HSL-3221]UFS63001.1 hypothetical protein LOH54_02485 [Sulfurimonas sp. HSL-3221]
MLINILNDEKFVDLMQRHVEELMLYLFEHDQSFGILCKIEHLSFEPELPEHITESFRPMTLFYLAGYTFDSARIDGNRLIFEAGFGPENIGSFVTVPLPSIMQIIIDETPIFINHAVYKEGEEEMEAVDDGGIENSMAAFLSNPENEKFLKKK